jgi:glycosyltransferase involved in cell wall biosynthesis
MENDIVIATIMREVGETGVQTHFNELLGYLRENKIPVRLITSFSAPQWAVYPLFSPRKFIDIFSKSYSVWWYRHWHFVCLRLALKSEMLRIPKVIYAQCPLSALAALQVRPSRAVRVVMAAHFNISQADEFVEKRMIDYGSTYYQSIRDLEDTVLPMLDGIVYDSDFIRTVLEQRIPGLSSVDSLVSPNFIKPLLVNANYPKIADLVTIGTLEPRKNQTYLLQILAEALRQGKRYTLSIIGDGDDRRHLESLAVELGIQSQVEFFGFRKDAAQLLLGHRAYCHVARIENLPLSILTAMSAGLPIFSTSVGGIPEMMKDGIEGRFFPSNDPKNAAAILVNIMENESLYNQLAQGSLQRFRSSFASSIVVPRLYNFLTKNSAKSWSKS